MRLLPDDKEIGWTPYLWTVYVLFFLFYASLTGAGVGEWIATSFGVLVFFALYFRGFWAKGVELLCIIAALTLLAVVFFPFNAGAGCFFIYAAAFAAQLGTLRKALLVIGIIEIITLTEALIFHLPF